MRAGRTRHARARGSEPRGWWREWHFFADASARLPQTPAEQVSMGVAPCIWQHSGWNQAELGEASLTGNWAELWHGATS